MVFLNNIPKNLLIFQGLTTLSCGFLTYKLSLISIELETRLKANEVKMSQIIDLNVSLRQGILKLKASNFVMLDKIDKDLIALQDLVHLHSIVLVVGLILIVYSGIVMTSQNVASTDVTIAALNKLLNSKVIDLADTLKISQIKLNASLYEKLLGLNKEQMSDLITFIERIIG